MQAGLSEGGFISFLEILQILWLGALTIFPTSMYHFKNFIGPYVRKVLNDTDMNGYATAMFTFMLQFRRYYICDCQKYIFEPDDMHIECPACEQPRYKNGDAKKPKGQYFYYFPLVEYLHLHWSHHPEWAKSCYHPWEGHKLKPGVIGDVYDTPNWKKHQCLSTPGNMGLALNADGMSVFKSGNSSVWPLYLMNMNLSPAKRYLNRNSLKVTDVN